MIMMTVVMRMIMIMTVTITMKMITTVTMLIRTMITIIMILIVMIAMKKLKTKINQKHEVEDGQLSNRNTR